MSRAVQGPRNRALRPGGPCCKKNVQVLGRGTAGLEFLVARVRGKVFRSREGCPPKGVLPDRAGSRTRRESPFRPRGAWDFGWLRPDLSLASEPAWQVRWLVRAGRPRARLGGSAPATGTSATGQATDSVGSFASVGLGRGSGIRPRDGDLRDGPGYGPPELISASEAGNPLGM